MTRSTEVQIKSTSPELHIFIAYKLPPPRIKILPTPKEDFDSGQTWLGQMEGLEGSNCHFGRKK